MRRLAAPTMAMLWIGLASCASAQERAAPIDTARYVKPGLSLERTRFHPAYPSEADALSGLVVEFALWMKPDSLWVRQFPYRAEALLDRPVVVRVFDRTQTPDRTQYYYCVPLVHRKWGVVDAYTYGRHYDSAKDEYYFAMGQHGGFGGRPGFGALYMMREEEARRLAERQLGVRVSRKPMAVYIGIRNIPSGGNTNAGWYWYMRADTPLKQGDKERVSIFVAPFCLVADPNNPTPDEMAANPRDSRGAGITIVFIRDRFYTFEGEDIDLYALDRNQRAAGDVAISSAPWGSVYLPEVIDFVPLEPRGRDEGSDLDRR